MSTGGPNTQRFSPFIAPLRGSFPLDRSHVCNPLVHDYLTCLRQYNLRGTLSAIGSDNTDSNLSDSPTDDTSTSSSQVCRGLAKLYLECRMGAGLMTAEDLDSLGFK